MGCAKCTQAAMQREVIAGTGERITIFSQNCDYITVIDYTIYQQTYQNIKTNNLYIEVGVNPNELESNLTLLDMAIKDKQAAPGSCNYTGYIETWVGDRAKYNDYIINH